MVKKLKGIFERPHFFKDFWETDKNGPIPKFPVIFYDKTVPHDIDLRISVETFYGEFIVEEPNKDEIIIDSEGNVFELAFHPDEGLRYPKLSKQIFQVDDLRRSINLWFHNKRNIYNDLNSIPDIIKEMVKNKKDFGYKWPDYRNLPITATKRQADRTSRKQSQYKFGVLTHFDFLERLRPAF